MNDFGHLEKTIVRELSCRLCLCTDVVKLKPLSAEVKRKIRRLFDIMVRTDDTLPKAICHDCLQQVSALHLYHVKVEKTQKFLEFHKMKMQEEKREVAAVEKMLHPIIAALSNQNIPPSEAQKKPVTALQPKLPPAELQQGDTKQTKVKGPKKKNVAEMKYMEAMTLEEFANSEKVDKNLLSNASNRVSSPKRDTHKDQSKNADPDLSTSCLDPMVLQDGKPAKQGAALDRQITLFYKMECCICHETGFHFRSLMKHYKERHGVPGYVTCCDKKFHYFYPKKIIEHMAFHLQPNIFMCQSCHQNFQTSQELYEHQSNGGRSEGKIISHLRCNKVTNSQNCKIERAMGSRSKKIISMVPIQDSNLKENNTLVETWLANFHPENQDNDHDSNLESSRFSINNITSTSYDTKNNLSATNRSTICDNDVDIVLIQEVNADSILTNTVIENVATKDIENAVITSERFNLSDDGEIVSSNVVITDTVPENTLAKTMLSQYTISNDNEMNPDNNEDFAVSDGSEYEPPKKKLQKKVFHPIRRTSSSSSDSSNSNSDSSSSSSGSSSSSSSSSGSRSKHSKSTSRSKRVSNVSIVHHNAASENIQPNTEQASIVTKSKKRTRNPSQWQKNQRKYLKNSGQGYTSTRGAICPRCSERYPTYHELGLHIVTHRGEKLQCDYCGKILKHHHRKKTVNHMEDVILCSQCIRTLKSIEKSEKEIKERVKAKINESVMAQKHHEKFKQAMGLSGDDDASTD